MLFNKKYIFLGLAMLFVAIRSMAQLSPGELSKAHANLEGLTKCVKCHVLGEKQTTPKCLKCHTEIQNLINNKKGYHASAEVKGNKCAKCHGEHFGRDFEIVKFEEKDFDHQLTGFKLEGKHKTLDCAKCHNPELVKNKISQKKSKKSFLGLGTKCLDCHDDFHQQTLKADCLSCHNQDAFRPAPKFKHENSNFKLQGAHKKVDCAKCHKTETRNSKKFQVFKGLNFAKCTDCHKDEHKGKFGTDCLKCHTINSFKQTKTLTGFDHDKTNFSLRGKHRGLDCKSCHKSKYTNPIKHEKCLDCHKDYHEGQLTKNNKIRDCNECHTVHSFKTSSFSFDEHKQTQFALDGAHMATPCFECHKKTEKWNFAVKTECITCHKNIHENFILAKYIPENNCKACHLTESWKGVTFDHNKTDFKLVGKHVDVTCRKCHFEELGQGKFIQKFKSLNQSCSQCHTDNHNNQFAENGVTTCTNCHTNNNWEPEKFNHNNTRFKLDGKHVNVSCNKCHETKTVGDKKIVVYQMEDISCKSCH